MTIAQFLTEIAQKKKKKKTSRVGGIFRVHVGRVMPIQLFFFFFGGGGGP